MGIRPERWHQCESHLRGSHPVGEIEPLILVAVSVPASERFWDYAPWPDQYRVKCSGWWRFLRSGASATRSNPRSTVAFGRFPIGGILNAGYSLGGLSPHMPASHATARSDWSVQLTHLRLGSGQGIYQYQNPGSIEAPGPLLPGLRFRTTTTSGSWKQLLVSRGYVGGIDLMSLPLQAPSTRIPPGNIATRTCCGSCSRGALRLRTEADLGHPANLRGEA